MIRVRGLGKTLMLILLACLSGGAFALDGPPSITRQPQSQAVTVGQRVSFGVEATGALGYAWTANGSIPVPSSFGGNSATVTIPAVPLTYSGITINGLNLRCRVSNASGGVDSDPAILTVLTPTATPTAVTPSPTPAPTATPSLPIAVVDVAAGTFTMGNSGVGNDASYGNSDELPSHQVTLSAYQIGKCKITNGQYCDVLNWALAKGYLKDVAGGAYAGGAVYGYGKPLAAVGDPQCRIAFAGGVFSPTSVLGAGGVSYSMATHPVVNINWFGALVFCNWLSEKEGYLPCYNLSTWEIDLSGDGYRLPTEAEWERAAAWDGEKHWIYSFQSDSIGTDRSSYIAVNPLGLTDDPRTSPVDWFDGVNISPNGGVQTQDSRSPAGAYDMSGNAWEWCQDWFGGYSANAQVDPKGPATGTQRVLRGGSWFQSSSFCRSANRNSYAPANFWSVNGFRVCLGGFGKGRPVITQQPQSQTVTVDQPVSFSVVAVGDGLTYQWKANGTVNVPASFGGTSSQVNIPAAPLTYSGVALVGIQLRCTVTNAGGSVVSNAASLTVTASR